MGQIKVNFKLTDKQNTKVFETVEGIYFDTKNELNHYMFGYITATFMRRKNAKLWAYDSQTNEIIHTVE